MAAFARILLDELAFVEIWLGRFFLDDCFGLKKNSEENQNDKSLTERIPKRG
jgi:hypothetical protein